jgi:hypothetical protein
MNWYYVEQGKQAGPVDEAQLVQMYAEAKIQDETLVWHEGMANWQPYRDVKITAAPPPPPFISPTPGAATAAIAATDAVCAECRNVFLKENMIHYGNSWVCATCKPVFMQKLAEGVTNLGGSSEGMVTEAELLARDYDVDIGGAVSKGWETFKANSGVMIGGSLIAYLGMMSGSLINLLRIPLIGIIIGLFISPPFRAGLWLLYVKSNRRGSADINDVFRGFGPRYWQIFLVALIPALLVFGILIIFGIFAALAIPNYVVRRNSTLPHPASAPSAMLAPLGILFLAVMLVYLFIATCWMFAMPLVVDKGLKFWPALELSRRVVVKHWWPTFALMIIVGLLAISGVIACGVGMLITGPIAFAALSAHYEKVFGDLAPQQS